MSRRHPSITPGAHQTPIKLSLTNRYGTASDHFVDLAPGHRVLADGTGDVSAGKQRPGRAGPGGGR
jgi:hypothetical protein